MGRPNCSRLVVYSPVMRTASAASPDISAHAATVACSTSQRSAEPSSSGPSTASPSRRTPSRTTSASGVPVVVSCRSRLTPSASAATRNSPTSPPSDPSTVAGTTSVSATSPAGTFVRTPSSTHPSPSRRAVVVGRPRSPSGSTSAAVSTVVPATTPGSRVARWSGVPNRATGSAPRARVARAGTGAVRRPTSSSTMASSSTPRPAPPCSAGTAMPSSPASAMAAHRSRSKRRSSACSTARMASGVLLSPSSLAATSMVACCSSLRSKSMVLLCAFSAWPWACPCRRPRSDPAAARWCRHRR